MLPSLRCRVSWCLRWSLVLKTLLTIPTGPLFFICFTCNFMSNASCHSVPYFWHLLHVRLARSVPRHWLVWQFWASCLFLGGWPVLGSFHPHRGHFQSKLSPESWACLLEQLPSWLIRCWSESKSRPQYLHRVFNSIVPLHLSWWVLRVTRSGNDCPQILQGWSCGASAGSTSQVISCLAHLRALLKIRLHFLHVSAVATVRSPCLGAAQRRLCLPSFCCRPMFANASARSFPGIWECPLTHLKLRGRCLLTSWYRVCARAASSWLAWGSVRPSVKLAA